MAEEKLLGKNRDSVLCYYISPSLYFRHVRENEPNHTHFFTHIHDSFELIYHIAGASGCNVETTTYPITADSLLIMRHMESHKMNVTCREPYERFTLNFSPEILRSIDPEMRLAAPFLSRALGEKNFYHSSEFDIHPKQLFSAMAGNAKDNNERRTLILINLFALLGQLASAFTAKKHEPLTDKKLPIVEITNYINEHLFDKLTLEMLAKKCYLSASQLSRQFKQATGFPVWEYIVNKRLSAARNMIQGGQLSTQVYIKCGFNDYSSFYRLYIKKYGISPKKDTKTKDWSENTKAPEIPLI